MNSSLVAISTLMKSNIGEKSLASFLMTVSNQGLRDYLKLANIYKGNAIKKKTDFIEMIIYGCITNKLNKETTGYIIKTCYSIIKKKWNNTKIITRIWKCRIEEKRHETC